MKIVFSSDGSAKQVSRGERITRGQNLSKRIYIEWEQGQSPIDTGQVNFNNLSVQCCITRQDGEQSGWYQMIKVDGENKYYYTLCAWDTAVSGFATLQVRWFDVNHFPDLRNEDYDNSLETIGSSATVSVSECCGFIVEEGKIAQPLYLPNDNADNLIAYVQPLVQNGLRKYDCANIPEEITYSLDGEKTCPAMYVGFRHNVCDVSIEGDNENEYTVSEKEGFLVVVPHGQLQIESFFTTTGNVYVRNIDLSVATEDISVFYDVSDSWKKDNARIFETENQRIVAEQERQQSEETRKLAEQERVIAEQNRIEELNKRVKIEDIVDNLESTNAKVPLSAKQGKELKEIIDKLHNITVLTNRDLNEFKTSGQFLIRLTKTTANVPPEFEGALAASFTYDVLLEVESDTTLYTCMQTITLGSKIYSRNCRSVMGQEIWSSWETKNLNITFDDTPTQDSVNPVTSGGLFEKFTNYYTQEQVLELIERIRNSSFEKVTSLPTEGESLKIYLIPKTTQTGQDYFDEYIYVDSAWEFIGTTQVDLSNYQEKLTFDDTPTEGSNNPVTSNGILNALPNIKQYW